ncbi:MAG: NUDIX domain-containing protein [Candidatus Izimaplasma sp.]|nr:NUDIX domain-containing protein [Candidatus Izimaplasma bacterium]
MEIEIFEGNIEKKDTTDLPHRIAARGIIEKDGKYLVVTLNKYDIVTFPGGGLEQDETLQECVIREVIEETGIVCKPIKETVRVTEYFTNSVWTNVYFLCDWVNSEGKQKLTQEETDLDLQVKWVTAEWLLDNFENNMTRHKFGPNIHDREFLGLIHSIEEDIYE